MTFKDLITRRLSRNTDYTQALERIEQKLFDVDFRLRQLTRSQEAFGKGTTNAEYQFVRRGNVWAICYAEAPRLVKDDLLGLRQVHRLLRQPHVPIPATWLMASVDDRAETRLSVWTSEDEDVRAMPHRFSRQEIVDRDTVVSVKRARPGIEKDIAQAVSTGRRADAARHRKVLHDIDRYFEEVLGKGGKPRTFPSGSPEENARSKVSKNLARAYATLDEAGLARVSEHLRTRIVPVGAVFIYQPSDPAPEWLLD